MLKQKLNKITDSPLISAVAALMLWAVELNGLFFLGNYTIKNLIFIMAAFFLIYPVITFVIYFIYAKLHGIKWYIYVVSILTVVSEYFLVTDFNTISPNIIVLTILCLVFGSGFGSCFSNSQPSSKDKNKTAKKQNKDDYKKILDD